MEPAVEVVPELQISDHEQVLQRNICVQQNSYYSTGVLSAMHSHGYHSTVQQKGLGQNVNFHSCCSAGQRLVQATWNWLSSNRA